MRRVGILGTVCGTRVVGEPGVADNVGDLCQRLLRISVLQRLLRGHKAGETREVELNLLERLRVTQEEMAQVTDICAETRIRENEILKRFIRVVSVLH